MKYLLGYSPLEQMSSKACCEGAIILPVTHCLSIAVIVTARGKNTK